MALRIEDYALLGDTQTAALVGLDGSIDWLCLPWFDCDACFAALLGTEENGHWRIAPAGRVKKVERRYRPGTLLLETEFTTDEGVVRVLDFMPPRQDTPDLVRVVEAVSGRVPMQMLLKPRFGYGRMRPLLRNKDCIPLAMAGPDALVLDCPLEVKAENYEFVANFEVEGKDRVPFVLTWFPSHTSAPKGVDGLKAVTETEEWWHSWLKQCTYDGQYGTELRESLLVLKALTYLPTGGIIAAATTSLPERIQGYRNWDYRFCWIRDATFTLNAFMKTGFIREANAWRDWLLRAVAGEPGQIQMVYGAMGERRLPEVELPWLPGFNEAGPVRIGNLAAEQFQLDVFGEVVDVLHVARRAGIPRDPIEWTVTTKLIDYLESHWSDPDNGIWEIRGELRKFTHSRVMAWVALDRAIRSITRFGLEGPMDRWCALREEIRRDVLQNGYDPDRESFVQVYGEKDLDASLLMIPLVGFLPADDPRMRGTIKAIRRELCEGGLVQRYRTRRTLDGLPEGEGAFLACSFWLADNLVLLGRHHEAEELFEHLLSLRNDVGLLSEQYDPASKRMLGNFPQAFSHVALVNTARYLSRGEHAPDERAHDGEREGRGE
jgi:GH15 family glucan-1,4-alpha-glucosidase